MSDDKNKKDYHDRTRISLTEPHEVQYWTKRFGIEKAMLEKAVSEVGHQVTDIEEFLKEMNSL